MARVLTVGRGFFRRGQPTHLRARMATACRSISISFFSFLYSIDITFFYYLLFDLFHVCFIFWRLLSAVEFRPITWRICLWCTDLGMHMWRMETWILPVLVFSFYFLIIFLLSSLLSHLGDILNSSGRYLLTLLTRSSLKIQQVRMRTMSGFPMYQPDIYLPTYIFQLRILTSSMYLFQPSYSFSIYHKQLERKHLELGRPALPCQ